MEIIILNSALTHPDAEHTMLKLALVVLKAVHSSSFIKGHSKFSKVFLRESLISIRLLDHQNIWQNANLNQHINRRGISAFLALVKHGRMYFSNQFLVIHGRHYHFYHTTFSKPPPLVRSAAPYSAYRGHSGRQKYCWTNRPRRTPQRCCPYRWRG